FVESQSPLFWVLGLGLLGLLIWLGVMEIQRWMGTTQIGHRPATVTGPSLHDDEAAEETPELQTAKRFVGGPRQISVQLKASEPSPWCAVIPVAKRPAETIPAPPSEPETATVNGRTSEPAYVDFEESSVGPVIGQVPGNGDTEISHEPLGIPSPTYAPADESLIEPSIVPAIATFAEIAGVGRAIAGIGALPEATEIPTASDEEHFASQPTTIETMPETLQTPTDPVIRAGGMHTAVEITLSCEIASMQLTPAFKVGA